MKIISIPSACSGLLLAANVSAQPPPAAPPQDTTTAPPASGQAPSEPTDPLPPPEPSSDEPVMLEAEPEAVPAEAATANDAIVEPPADPVVTQAPPTPDPIPEPPTAEPPAGEAPAPSVTPLKVTGSFWSRYELREGYEEHAALGNARLHREGDTVVYRARLGVETNPLDVGGGQSFSIKFAPQASGTHSLSGTPLVTVGDAYDLGVYEAYTRLQSKGFSLDVGRFMMDYGDAMVIGNLGWHETARAFQGARTRLSGDSGYYTDLFVTLISEGSGTTGAVFEGDRYFYGIYTGIGPAIGKLDLDLYLLGQSFGKVDGVVLDDTVDPPTTGDQAGATFLTLGARIKQAIDLFDYHAEAGLQFGSTPVVGGEAQDKLAYHADAGVGITPAAGLRLGLGGLVASGDSDPTDDKSQGWDQLFPTAHKFLGLADVFGGRTNAVSGNADVSYKASKSLILKLQAHLLATMEENAAGETYSGTELDTHIVHPIGAGATLRGMYAVFLPNEAYWAGVSDSVHYLEVQYGIDF